MTQPDLRSATPKTAIVLSASPDEALIRTYQGGERSAFEALFARHARQVRSLLWHLTLSTEKADRLATKTWLLVHAQRDQAPTDGHVVPWLLGLAAQVVRDDVTDGKLLSPPESPPIVAALAALPDRNREAVVLCDVLKLPPAEAARTLATTEATILQRVQQAREQLAAQLGESAALVPLDPEPTVLSLERLARSILPVVAHDLRPRRSYARLVGVLLCLVVLLISVIVALLR